MKHFSSSSLFTLFMSCFFTMPVIAQTGNVGIGTTSPTTKLDVNGAITNREGTAITVSGTAVTVPNLAYSQYRLTGSPTAAFAITGPTTSNGTLALVAGARLILVNATTQIGTLNGTPIQPGTAQEFAYTNGAWVATNGGARPDYDWMKSGNIQPTAAGDTANNIYHIGGNVGIGTSNPTLPLTVQATSEINGPVVSNWIANFFPFGGSNVNKSAAISVNSRAFFGYDLDATSNKYAFLRGNNSTDMRFQVMDGNGVLDSNSIFIQGAASGFGSVGINHSVPQARLDVRGSVKVLANPGTQTGRFWDGTSNMNGFEISTTAAGDSWVGIQRQSGACLHLSKPAGTPAGQAMLIFAVNGGYVGNVTYNGTGVTYNVTSDVRLKESIRSTHYSLKDLMKIKVADYFYKSDKDHSYPQTGFLAQQLYGVFPMAVTKGGANPKKDPWMIDYSKVTPLLVKSVQELTHRVELLEKENASLKEQQETISQLAAELKELKQMLKEKKETE